MCVLQRYDYVSWPCRHHRFFSVEMQRSNTQNRVASTCVLQRYDYVSWPCRHRRFFSVEMQRSNTENRIASTCVLQRYDYVSWPCRHHRFFSVEMQRSNTENRVASTCVLQRYDYVSWATFPWAHLLVVGMLRFISFNVSLQSLPTPFRSFLVSISVSTALSIIFYSINSPNKSPFSHSVLLVLFLPYWSFQLCISLPSLLKKNDVIWWLTE